MVEQLALFGGLPTAPGMAPSCPACKGEGRFWRETSFGFGWHEHCGVCAGTGEPVSFRWKVEKDAVSRSPISAVLESNGHRAALVHEVCSGDGLTPTAYAFSVFHPVSGASLNDTRRRFEDARAEAEVMARLCGYVVPARETA